MMRRREFITLLGGAAAGWPHAAHAQPVDRVRQIGVLQGLAPTDPEYLRRVGAFRRSLQELGWSENKNIAIHSLSPRRTIGPSSRVRRRVGVCERGCHCDGRR